MAAPGIQLPRTAGFCSHCGAQIGEWSKFCASCGTPVIPMLRQQFPDSSHQATAASPHAASRGFAQIFGLHPTIAFLTVAVDLMLHSADVLSLGLLEPFSVAGGIVLGIIAFMAQKKWYGDDKESALIKALIVGLLTAIPSPLPYFLFVPAGILGFFRRKKV